MVALMKNTSKNKGFLVTSSMKELSEKQFNVQSTMKASHRERLVLRTEVCTEPSTELRAELSTELRTDQSIWSCAQTFAIPIKYLTPLNLHRCRHNKNTKKTNMAQATHDKKKHITCLSDIERDERAKKAKTNYIKKCL